jgi:hypothetical protein
VPHFLSRLEQKNKTAYQHWPAFALILFFVSCQIGHPAGKMQKIIIELL